jgi:RNA polymerase primary sigma factor
MQDHFKAATADTGPQETQGYFYPLLTHQQEIALAKQIEAGQHARNQLLHINDPAERARLEQDISDGIQAKARLWERNYKLVESIAKRYIGKGLLLDDLVQEGNLGLEQAIIRFEWQRGLKFSTYAYWWIRQGITRAINNQARMIRLPGHTIDFMYSLFRATEELYQKNASEPDVIQIAEHVKAPVNKVRATLRFAYDPISLQLPSGHDDTSTIEQFIPGTDNVAEEFEQKSLIYEVIDKLSSILTKRELNILDLRYGLSDGERHTLKEIGTLLGITRERVRQIEAESLRKLRDNFKTKYIFS